jgi:hypothetical protein
MEVSNLVMFATNTIIGTPPNTLPSGAIDPKDINTRIAGGISLILSLVVLMSVFQIIMGGINYVNAGGDPNKTKAAQQVVTNAVIGLAVAFSSYVILLVVGGALGIKDFSFSL